MPGYKLSKGVGDDRFAKIIILHATENARLLCCVHARSQGNYPL